MFVDYIQGGVGHGPVGGMLNQGQMVTNCRFDPSLLRPYIGNDGRRYVTVNTGQFVYDNKRRCQRPVYKAELITNLQARGINSPVFNATSLRKEEWVHLDQVVLRSARFRLRAWADLAKANSFGGFNGMSKLVLEHETMSDPGEAVVDMDGLTEGRNDAPKFQLEGLPLPITHSDFWFSARTLAISRNTGTPLDTTMGEASGRRVAEMIEKTTIGVDTGITYGGNSSQVGGYGRTSSVYGYLNFPARLTKTNLYKPTGVGRAGTGWTPLDTLKDILAMRNALYLNKFYGPFMVYHSNDWDEYMDSDYILTGGNVATQTLRERIQAIGGIMPDGVRRLDFLTAAATASGDPANITTTNPWTLIMVQMTADVCRAVNGMDITTVQWETVGGLRVNFKVLTISVPQLRADFTSHCGILHANASTGV
jgi:hypothetical protein